MVAHGPKLFLKNDFPEDLNEIIIRPVGDIHFGNPMQNEKIVEDLIYELKWDERQYWINAGDMLENNGKEQSHDGVWTDTMTPEQQLETYIEKFSPVVDKLLCAIDGNHDNRTKNKTQISLMRRAAKEMGYFDRYTSDGAYLVTRFGNRLYRGRRERRPDRQCLYRGFITHGSTSGTTTSSKASGLEKLGNICNADYYVGAHTHSQIVFRDRFYEFDENNKNSLSHIDRWYINTGSALEYGGYALTARYTPQPPGYPYIHLKADREEIEVTLK
jgi:hypothetical protein